MITRTRWAVPWGFATGFSEDAVLILVWTYCRKQIGTSGCVPQPIAGPGQAGTKTHTAQDRDRPGGGRDELSYPETEQGSGSAHSNEDADQRGSVAVLIMATPNSR